MRVDIAWWDLDGRDPTIDSLRDRLDDEAGPWAQVAGLRVKLWVADRARNRWGAVMLWESDRPTNLALPPNCAAEMIGRPADHRTWFDVEVAVEGVHPLGDPGGRDDVVGR